MSNPLSKIQHTINKRLRKALISSNLVRDKLSKLRPNRKTFFKKSKYLRSHPIKSNNPLPLERKPQSLNKWLMTRKKLL